MMNKKEVEQGTFDPVSGRNITGDIVSESKAELTEKIGSIVDGIYNLIEKNESPESILKSSLENANQAVYDHFQSIKQPVDRNFLNKQLKRIEKVVNVYRELLLLGKVAESQNIEYSITASPKVSFHFGWTCNEKPLFLTIDNSCLLAVPLTNMTTEIYGPSYLGGTPPAAELVRVTNNAMVFISPDSTPPDDFISKIKTPAVSVSEVIPCVGAKRKGPLIDVSLNDPECVSCEASPAKEDVINIVKKELPEIKIVGINTSGSPVKEFILV